MWTQDVNANCTNEGLEGEEVGRSGLRDEMEDRGDSIQRRRRRSDDQVLPAVPPHQVPAHVIAPDAVWWSGSGIS